VTTLRETLCSRVSALGLVLAVLVAVTGCGGSDASEADCPTSANVVFWGGTQWLELAKALAAHRADCTEYYVTIPPQDSDKTLLRSRKTFEQVRVLDPHIHPVAEIRYTSEVGWRAWVVGQPGRTFYEAGVEVRRRMEKAGLDVSAGETWSLNELDAEIRENVPGRRDEVREFLRGLYEGAEGMPEARGIVFDLGSLGVTDLQDYKASLQEWLTDGPFWSDLDKYVDFFAEEVYTGPQTWAVDGASLATRTEHLNGFLYHVPVLAQAGAADVEPARRFLERTYVPLTNAAWPHALIGQTHLVSPEEMAQFVSGEVYAMREYSAGAETVPQNALGFAWAPNPAEPSYSDAGRDTVLNRLATALHDAAPPGSQPIRACGSEGGQDWCAGVVEGAALDDAWKMFATWD
jgi:hypothetical protein